MTAARLQVDRDICIGSGNCVRVAETVFDQDEDGRVVLLAGADPDAHTDDVSLAVAGCPVGALWTE
jgi:ferredoxin